MHARELNGKRDLTFSGLKMLVVEEVSGTEQTWNKFEIKRVNFLDASRGYPKLILMTNQGYRSSKRISIKILTKETGLK